MPTTNEFITYILENIEDAGTGCVEKFTFNFCSKIRVF